MLFIWKHALHMETCSSYGNMLFIWKHALHMETCSSYGNMLFIWKHALHMETCSSYGNILFIWKHALHMETCSSYVLCCDCYLTSHGVSLTWCSLMYIRCVNTRFCVIQVPMSRWGLYNPPHYEQPNRVEPLPSIHGDQKHLRML